MRCLIFPFLQSPLSVAAQRLVIVVGICWHLAPLKAGLSAFKTFLKVLKQARIPLNSQPPLPAAFLLPWVQTNAPFLLPLLLLEPFLPLLNDCSLFPSQFGLSDVCPHACAPLVTVLSNLT